MREAELSASRIVVNIDDPGAQPWVTSVGRTSFESGLGTPCRQVPDVSADADEYTGYAEYCTGSTGEAAAGGAHQRPVPDHPGYDEATGVGTPKFAAIITG